MLRGKKMRTFSLCWIILRVQRQIHVETQGEEKINNSYQSIYKRFTEILGSLVVVPVETVGNPFGPLLHEAIMREESAEFEEGIILKEYRKGFKLGDRHYVRRW